MVASSFDRLFRDPDGLLGSVFLDSISPTLSLTSLPRLVVTKGLIEASQAKSTYGHWRTKTQCRSDPTLHYWKNPSDLPEFLHDATLALNPTALSSLPERIQTFRTAPIGCILVVTQRVTAESADNPSPPVIMLLAAPSMATIPSPLIPGEAPGILYEDIWDATVTTTFADLINSEDPHCPVLAASEGFSRAVVSATPKLYLDDAKPLFFPSGELLCETVAMSTGTTYRSYFLPEVCSPPIGLIWPTDIGYDLFTESIQALGRPYKSFLQTIEALEPSLSVWFLEVTIHPEKFSVPSWDYIAEISTAFPSLEPDGVYPTAITDPRGFSPLADMRYGFLWRLHCDRVLTMTTGPGLQHFRTFLTRGAEGITAATYLGAAIPGQFCPNFGFHFKPHNNVWPTDTNPIEHFSTSALVSLEARDYDPVTIEVHGDRWAPIPSLLSRDQLSTLRHREATPKHSRIATPTAQGQPQALGNPPPAPPIPQALAAGQATDPTAPRAPNPVTNPFDGQHAADTPPLPPRPPHTAAALPGMNNPFIPPQVQPFSPPPLRHSTPAPGSGDTPFNHAGRTLFHQPNPSSLAQQPAPSHGHSTSRRFDYERASLENDTTRRAANMEFLSVYAFY
jgi:hypothetical protein